MHEKQQQRTASQLKRYSVHGGQAARGPEGQGAWQRRGRSPGLGHMGSAALLRFEVNVQSMQPGSIYYDLMRSLRERGDFGGSPGEPGGGSNFVFKLLFTQPLTHARPAGLLRATKTYKT